MTVALAHEDLASSYVETILRGFSGIDAVVLRDAHRGLTGDQVVRTVDAYAATFRSAGVAEADVVALLMAPNVLDLVLARWAAHRLGATVVHLRSANPRTDVEQLPVGVQADVLTTTDAQFLVTDRACVERAADLAERCPKVQIISGATDASSGSFGDLPISPHTPAVIDFTSGTTREPRLVSHTHGGRTRLLERLSSDGGGAAARFCSVTPITHTTAPMIDACALGGGSIVIHDEFDADRVLDEIENGLTDIYLAVPHLCALLDHPRTRLIDRSRLRRVIYSGTPAARHRVRQAYEVFGPAIVQVYGSTETGGISALTAPDHAEPLLTGSVGRPFPWVSVQVRSDDGQVCADGTNGLVWVCSPTCMAGYLAPDHRTEQPDHGWVCTGDVGRFDEYGYLTLVGRASGVIKFGGLKLYPESIEAALTAHPAVLEAAVQGVADAERREHVHAAVVLVPGEFADEGELADLVHQRLGAEHVPEKFVYWQGLPLTNAGKVNRRLVRQLLGG